MERKNTVLLTVIAIATLLVAVVGATFAYFTASNTTNGKAPETDVTAADLKGSIINFEGEKEKFDMLDYPGGIGVFGAKATITKQNEDDKNDYQATFNLKIEYTNKTGTDLEWALYMVDEENKITELNPSETTTCTLQQKKNDDGTTMYWYSDTKTQTADETEDQGCTASAITSKLEGNLQAKKLASGKLKSAPNEETKTITKETETDEFTAGDGAALENRVINTKDKKAKYYYLVVKYPNKNEDQAPEDAGRTISVKLSLDGTPASTLYKTE